MDEFLQDKLKVGHTEAAGLAEEPNKKRS